MTLIILPILIFISIAIFLYTEDKRSFKKFKEQSLKHQDIFNSCYYMLKDLGIPSEILHETSKKITNEALSTLPKGIDPYVITLGDITISDQNFMKPRLDAGLTIDDIRTYWNQPPLKIACEAKIREFNQLVFLTMVENQGKNVEEEALFYKKVTPRYGLTHKWDIHDKYNIGLTENDADLYPEFSNRINQWLSYTSKDQIDNLIKRHGSFNAVVRNLIKVDFI